MPRKLSPGLYEKLITDELAKDLSELSERDFLVEKGDLDPADSHVALARHLYSSLLQRLGAISGDNELGHQVALCNSVLALLALADDRESIRDPAEELKSLTSKLHNLAVAGAPNRPSIPLVNSDLLVNAQGEPGIGHLVNEEIPSADRIDLLCAFIKWNGFRILEPALRAYRDLERPLRVITTTYIGATERRALDALCEMGAQVKVSYETRGTRLHAKAWMFHRNTGYSTAYVGSSNLSAPALLDGLEWNVRVSQIENLPIIEKFKGVFETYWASPDFETYDPERDAARFDSAVRVGRGGQENEDLLLLGFDIQPYPFQQEILDKIEFERVRHDRHQNLVVAATGTGKTIIAGLDFKRLRSGAGRNLSLLFVAHREEILTQSQRVFREILREGDFGELLVNGEKPKEGHHVFASIQSLSRIDLSQIRPDAYDVVIVDEIHHSAAMTYRRLLEHLRPVELLGLTATPERSDGESILGWFGGRIAAELRLWEALERGVLCPFQYFGIHDGTDLSTVAWTRGRYDFSALTNVYTGDHARVKLIAEELIKKVTDAKNMRALGFCVSVKHAEFMAQQFAALGIPAIAISGETPDDERRSALKRLKSREVNVVFAVDLFNEGIDLPEIDTVLFLRPTESATVFLQQLGRGLRKVDGKDCLTVLDFIGQANRRFRFDLRFRALTGTTRTELAREVEAGFPHLPAGCSMQIDRVASKIVLDNIRQALGTRLRNLVDELRNLGDIPLMSFLSETGLELADIYRNNRSYLLLQREAGFQADASEADLKFAKKLAYLTHVDDPERLEFFRKLFSRDSPPEESEFSERERRIYLPFHFATFGVSATLTVDASLETLWGHPRVLAEILQILSVLETTASRFTFPLEGELSWGFPIPLAVHSQYTLEDILTAFGNMTFDKRYRMREGKVYDPVSRSDILVPTVEKSEKHYSPTTRYRDYAISRELFHWESQNTTTERSPTAQRYIHHRKQGTNILLFVRKTRMEDGQTAPYVFLGSADYVSHTGEKPLSIVWRLRRAAPADMFHDFQLATG